jgi:hypothetical protein
MAALKAQENSLQRRRGDIWPRLMEAWEEAGREDERAADPN